MCCETLQVKFSTCSLKYSRKASLLCCAAGAKEEVRKVHVWKVKIKCNHCSLFHLQEFGLGDFAVGVFKLGGRVLTLGG
jgi:hypothetical protein